MVFKDFKNKKVILIVGVIFLLAIFIFFFVNLRKKTDSNQVNEKATQESVETKVLKNLEVKIEKAKKEGAVMLVISNIPQNTESIEYELTYLTQDKGLQGVIGTIDEINSSSYKKEIFLGTCSSGTCVKHKLAGSINLLLKFRGSYGEATFEREFKI